METNFQMQNSVAGCNDNAVSELTPAQLLQRQCRLLLHALQTGHPVMYQQRQRFVHTLRFQQSGGNVEADVYLVGQPDSVPPMELTLDPDYNKKYSLRK